jgi:hypothetical protein
MGPAGLTAVFGMGTGVTPPVSSPRNRPAGGQATPAEAKGPSILQFVDSSRASGWQRPTSSTAWPQGDRTVAIQGHPPDRPLRPTPAGVAAAGRGGQAARLLGPVRCDAHASCTPGPSTWSYSRSLPGRMARGNLVSKRVSRLDAFSAYPFPAWLPSDALSRTTGTPEAGPPQSSRTRGEPSQVSYTHGR